MEKPKVKEPESESPDIYGLFPELVLRSPDELDESSTSPEVSPIHLTEAQEKEWHEKCESNNREIDNEQKIRRLQSFKTTTLIGIVLVAIIVIYMALQPKDHSMDRQPGETNIEYQARVERAHYEEREQDLSGGSHGF